MLTMNPLRNKEQNTVHLQFNGYTFPGIPENWTLADLEAEATEVAQLMKEGHQDRQTVERMAVVVCTTTVLLSRSKDNS